MISVFKHFCVARGQKIEAKNLKFALTAEVIRRGGLLVAAIIRYSFIPGHGAWAPYAALTKNCIDDIT